MSFFGKIFSSLSKGLGSLFKSGASKLGNVVGTVQKLGSNPIVKNIVSSTFKQVEPPIPQPQQNTMMEQPIMADRTDNMPIITR